MKLTIPGRFPGLNEIVAAAKSHYAKYSTDLVITWFEPDRRRDPDNIMAGQKFILDGLSRA